MSNQGNKPGAGSPLRTMGDMVEAQSNIAGMARSINPTLRENIDQKIQWHLDEIARLGIIKEKLPQLLDVNLRDLREAMQF